jgi:hypothetical protein
LSQQSQPSQPQSLQSVHWPSLQSAQQPHSSQLQTSPQQHPALATSTALADAVNPNIPVEAATNAAIKYLDMINSPKRGEALAVLLKRKKR